MLFVAQYSPFIGRMKWTSVGKLAIEVETTSFKYLALVFLELLADYLIIIIFYLSDYLTSSCYLQLPAILTPYAGKVTTVEFFSFT